jgi:hypothetical protein
MYQLNHVSIDLKSHANIGSTVDTLSAKPNNTFKKGIIIVNENNPNTAVSILNNTPKAALVLYGIIKANTPKNFFIFNFTFLILSELSIKL